MAGFGSCLREERIRQGYTLEMVESETKIRKMYLVALEEENFSILPPRVYAIGFVRRYSQFLNLDEEEMVNQFKSLAFPESDEENEAEKTNFKNTLLEGEKKSRFINSISAIVFVMVLIGVGSLVLKYVKSNTGNIANNTQPPGISVENPMEQVPNEPVHPPEVDEVVLRVAVKPGMSCWLSVSADGQNIFTGTLTNEQNQEFKANQTLKIRAGNAGALVLEVNGKDLGVLGNKGEVVEKVFNINDFVN